MTLWDPKGERQQMFLCKENESDDPKPSGRGAFGGVADRTGP